MPQLLIAGLGAGASVLGSALSGKSKTQTSQSTSTSTPTMTPETQELMKRLMGFVDQSTNNPMQGLQPIKNAATDNINRNYRGIPQRLASQFASRGYGSSGSFGNSLYNTEYARGGDLSALEGQFANKAIDQQNFGATLGSQLLNFGRGQTTTTNSTGTQPGNMVANGLMSGGNGLENIATMLMMSKILGGGSSGNMNTSGGGGMS